MTEHQPRPDPCSVNETDEHITLLADGREVLTFQKRASKFNRAAIIHPLYHLDGGEITRTGRDGASNGLFHGWAQVRYRELDINLWDGKEGTVLYQETANTWAGKKAGFAVDLVHTALPGKGKVSNEYIIFDTLSVEVHVIPEGWRIAYQSEQICASTHPVEIPEQDLGGGLALHWNDKWLGGAANSQAIDRGYLLTGPTEKGQARLALVAQPAPESPPEGILLENMKGRLFCHFSPVRRKALRMEPGKTYTWRYHLYVLHPDAALPAFD